MEASVGELFTVVGAVGGQQMRIRGLRAWVSHVRFRGVNSLAASAHLYSFCQLHISSCWEFSLPEMSWDLEDKCSEKFPEGETECIDLQDAQFLTVIAIMMHRE